MGKELTERQAEVLRDVRLLYERHKEVQAEEKQLFALLLSAIRAAAVEGVKQRQIALSIKVSDSWVSQIIKKAVRPWWDADRAGGVSPRDEWHAWLAEHQPPEPPQ
ncbi:hypothetical protein ACXJJ3_42015 (plasmid) [Kribbella sp. WER1]